MMLSGTLKKPLVTAIAVVVFAWPTLASAQQHAEVLGLLDLWERIGQTNAPTGSGVVAGLAEAPDGDGDYAPDPGATQFNDKTFNLMSGPTNDSSHATTVGKYQFGRFWSMAKDITEIYVYSAFGFVTNDYLRTGAGFSVPPLPTPGGMKVLNQSWVGSFSNPADDNECLRRADLLISRDQLVITNGVNNSGGASLPLMSHLYNGISVGIRAGVHVSDATAAPYDGPGRIKPEIVGPADYTSFATPLVNATASLLIETARTWPGLDTNSNALRTDVLKAAILAGAVHENLMTGAWTNNPETAGPSRGVTAAPIDHIVGTGSVNINRSHFILTGLEQDGSETPPAGLSASWSGWDRARVGLDESSYYRFVVPEPAAEVSILITWNRDVRLSNNTWKLADFDLTLWRVDPVGGGLVPLTGDDGLAWYGGGNVVSASGVDNVEHLYLTDLEPAAYVLQVERVDAVTSHPNWDVAVAWLFPEYELRAEDVDQDGIVGFLDLLAVLSNWGSCDGCPEDVDGDGLVGFLDVVRILSEWDS